MARCLFDQSDIREICRGINDYGEAYSRFENLQDRYPTLLQRGDQKTGVIGEFFGLLFACHEWPNAQVELCKNHSGDEYDILLTLTDGTRQHIQVKTVSAYSSKRKASPLNLEKLSRERYWLFVLSLDRSFEPEGLWIFNDLSGVDIDLSAGFTVPSPLLKRSGSQFFSSAINRAPELQKLLEHYNVQL